MLSDKKNMYRENFPGYMGHIPYKFEIIGRTIGATNNYIKSFLFKEPDYKQTFIPSQSQDYTYYKKDYFNKGYSKEYELEEDKIFSMRSKDAKTWIDGYKHTIYPEHIPGYGGKVPGIEPAGKKGSPIIGTTYSKATAIAIKGDYNKDSDIPPNERYISTQKASFVVPQIRSKDDIVNVRRMKEIEEEGRRAIQYFDQLNKNPSTVEYEKNKESMSDKFKEACEPKVNKKIELPYIVGYKGFRRGVVSDNYYGKNFREIAYTSVSRSANYS